MLSIAVCILVFSALRVALLAAVSSTPVSCCLPVQLRALAEEGAGVDGAATRRNLRVIPTTVPERADLPKIIDIGAC